MEKEKGQAEWTNETSAEESTKKKRMRIINALFVGFLLGIVVYSIWINSLGFFTLIPLLLAYRLANKATS